MEHEAILDVPDSGVSYWTPEYADLFDQWKRSQDEGTIHAYLGRLGLLQKGISVLSIGGGSGDLEVSLATGEGARIGYVDPSAILYRRFVAGAASAGVTDQVVERHLGTFQSYASGLRWDLALSVHSWAYIGRSRPMLEKALGLLNPGGRLCIVLGSEDSDLEALKALVRPAGEGPAYLESLSRWAASAGYPHRVDRVESSIPADRWLQPDGFTGYGKAWLAYMGRASWDALSAERKQRAEAFVRETQMDGRLQNVWGALVFEK